MPTIPGAPDGGGALASYLDKYEGEVGWMPQFSDPISKDLIENLKGDLNNPETWVGFAGHAVKTVWESLPPQVRAMAQDQLSKLVANALSGLSTAMEAAGASISSVGSAVPLIGAIFDAVLIIVRQFIDLGKEISDEKKMTAAFHFMNATLYTIEKNEHPDDWVIVRTKVTNYLNRRSRDWWYKPSFSRSGGASDRMFYNGTGPTDKGNGCKDGVEVYCGAKEFVNMADCHKRDSDKEYCTRYVMISALFYPFWSPAYPDKTEVTEKDYEMQHGWGESGGSTPSIPETSNTLLISRQMALLTSPSVNLQVDADRLLRIRDHFQSWFLGQARAFAAPDRGSKKHAVLPISHNHKIPGAPPEDRLRIDWEKKEQLPGASDPHQLYFDDEGLIQSYGEAKISEWGVWAIKGPQTPDKVAVSCAQYNTVLSATLAFMSARANFLRNGPVMRKLLLDFDLDTFDSKVRSAMEYSADLGVMLPAPSRAAPGPIPNRIKKQVSGGGGGGAVLALGAAAALALVLKGRG